MRFFNGSNKRTQELIGLRRIFAAVALCVLVTAVSVFLTGCSKDENPAPGPTASATLSGSEETENNSAGKTEAAGDSSDASEAAVGNSDATEGTADNTAGGNSEREGFYSENYEPLGQGMMRLIAFDAGHADAFLLYTDEAVILIDTGEKGFGKKILKYMDKAGLTGIDYMLLTHFDKDHIGGAAKVIRDSNVANVYTGTFTKDSDEMHELAAAMVEKDCSREMLMADKSFEIGGMKVEINTPERMIYEEDPSNNSSLIIRISHGENVFLFMADAQNTRIREYLDTAPAACKLLKVPYHGIFQGELPELFDAVKPEVAVITSAKNEKEDEETRQLLKDRKIEIYKTRKGDVDFLSDGKSLIINQ
ncbi:MAG: MBL fold metallo-hydrolase [Lachnospiraceae bacterium]|nr:MBL fold metallo-hydrolase [Lachnospiraceae bacterium]